MIFTFSLIGLFEGFGKRSNGYKLIGRERPRGESCGAVVKLLLAMQHPILERWFQSRLLCFRSSFLLVHLEREEMMA